ncbi:MAG: Bax inhibitor-1/YccA family protein [Ilumatobacteraceae bacterium]|jgi:uncharacterized YccA/Bax inhibitor family protein
MSNPILNERTFSRVASPGTDRHPGEAGWGAPRTRPAQWQPPITDGPVSPWRTDGAGAAAGRAAGDAMTAGGAASAALLLTAMLLVAALVGWMAVPTTADGSLVLPGWTIGAALVGFGLAIVMAFKATLARFLAPVYAVAEGLFLGAISRAFEAQYDGIVLQAVGATMGVFVTMLVLYRSGIIRVSARMRRIVMGATLGIALFYGVALVASLFGASLSFLSSSSPLGILLSLVVAGIAAANLALDFDFIEQGERAGLPKHMEWFAAFGLLVTLVWLYLEILRLLAKLRDR